MNEIKSNEELRDGNMEGIVKAMEHDTSDVPEFDAKKTYDAIEHGVVGTYQKIEDTVVSGYKGIEKGVVEGFTKMTDKIVGTVFAREGETVEEAKERLKK